MLLAGILFGLVPLLAVATNGYILGVAYLFASRGVGYVQAVKTVLPHGVLEIPAIILTSAYGLWLGVTFAKQIRQRDMAGFGDQVIHGIRMFFKIAFPLFILAALIETFLILRGIYPWTIIGRARLGKREILYRYDRASKAPRGAGNPNFHPSMAVVCKGLAVCYIPPSPNSHR